MKIHLSYIPLLLIPLQIAGSKKNVSGKYVSHFCGKHELILKNNGKFVSKGYKLKYTSELRYRDPKLPPPREMSTPGNERKKLNTRRSEQGFISKMTVLTV